MIIFIQQIVSENVICKILPIMLKAQCAELWTTAMEIYARWI